MAGSSLISKKSRRGFIVQPRDITFLRLLATLKVVDREICKTVAGFGKQEEKVAGMRTELTREERELSKLQEAKKVLEAV